MVINGYSEVMQEVFGQAGVGVRSAVGMILPHGIYAEVQNICTSAHRFSVVAAWFLCRISAHLLIFFVAAWFLNGCILMHEACGISDAQRSRNTAGPDPLLFCVRAPF